MLLIWRTLSTTCSHLTYLYIATCLACQKLTVILQQLPTFTFRVDNLKYPSLVSNGNVHLGVSVVKDLTAAVKVCWQHSSTVCVQGLNVLHWNKHFIVQLMQQYIFRRYIWNDKIRKIASPCFGSQRIRHQGALYSSWLKVQKLFYQVRWHGGARCYGSIMLPIHRPCLYQRKWENNFCNFNQELVQGSLMMDRLWSETCRSNFKYFIIFNVSTKYILVH